MDKEQGKKDYRKLFERVRDIVIKHDPMALMRFGNAPIDEYDEEVAMILPLLRQATSVDDLAKRISGVLGRQFDYNVDSVSHEGFIQLASDLYDFVEQHKRGE